MERITKSSSDRNKAEDQLWAQSLSMTSALSRCCVGEYSNGRKSVTLPPNLDGICRWRSIEQLVLLITSIITKSNATGTVVARLPLDWEHSGSFQSTKSELCNSSVSGVRNAHHDHEWKILRFPAVISWKGKTGTSYTIFPSLRSTEGPISLIKM